MCVCACCENKLLINSGNDPSEETEGVLRAGGLKANIYPRKEPFSAHPTPQIYGPAWGSVSNGGGGWGGGQSGSFRGCCRFLLPSVCPSETLEVLRVALGSLLAGISIWVSVSDKRKLQTLSDEFLSQTDLTVAVATSSDF